MLFTLLASLGGFVSGFLPQLVGIWKQRQDNAQELAIFDRQLEQSRLSHGQKIEELDIIAVTEETKALYTHDAELKGSAWVENLRASVRPVITYSFFLLFSVVKITTLVVLSHDGGLLAAIPQLWDETTQILFAAVLSFWFGNRAASKILR